MTINNTSCALYTVPRIPLEHMRSYLTQREAAYFSTTSLTFWRAFPHSELHLTGTAAKPVGFEKTTAAFVKMIREGRCPKERFTAIKISPSLPLNAFKYTFSEDSMCHIVHLPLRRLEFENSTAIHIDEGCFQHFALAPSLTQLLLPINDKSDNDRSFANTISHLAQMKLHHLRISNICLQDEDFALFATMPLEKLELLNLSPCNLTSLCLDHLEKLPLKELTIQTKNKEDRIQQELEYHCKDAPIRKIASLKKINGKEIPGQNALLVFSRHTGAFKTDKSVNEWILTFLSLHDALSFRKTCRSFTLLRVKNGTLNFTQRHCESSGFYPYLLHEQLVQAIKKNIFYSAICLSHSRAYSSPRLIDVALDCLRYFPLKTLTIGKGLDCSDKGYQKLVKANQLEHLTLFSIQLDTDKNKLSHLKNLKNLQTLTLSSYDIADENLAFLTLIPSLRALILRNPIRLTSACLDTLQQLPNLERLTIEKIDRFDSNRSTEELIAFIRQKLPRLKEFNGSVFIDSFLPTPIASSTPILPPDDPVPIATSTQSLSPPPAPLPNGSLPPPMPSIPVNPINTPAPVESSTTTNPTPSSPPGPSTGFFSYIRSFFHAIWACFASLAAAIRRLCSS